MIDRNQLAKSAAKNRTATSEGVGPNETAIELENRLDPGTICAAETGPR